MSQEKAQLIAPQGHFTVPGLNVAGVVTASSFSGNCTGTASSLAQGSNLVVGVMTASSFAGDVFGNAAGLSTTTAGLKLGIVTATSFGGNFTGIGSGLTGTPNIVAGLITASQFIGNTPGLAAGLSAGKNLAAGIVTATTFHGDGSGLTGAGSTAFIRQDVTAQSGTTTINLNDGNIIYLTHSNNTTIAFSNVKTADDVTIIRTLTNNTITWPTSITWNGGSAPTLAGANSYSLAGQVFNLVTYNGGTNWYGYEEVNNTMLGSGYELFSAGKNDRGQLGQNNRTEYSSPVQVGSSSKWFIGPVSQGQRQNLATKNDGTLWSWGYNRGNNLLGINASGNRSSPVQIPGTTWNQPYIGVYSSSARKSDGTLWTWGANNFGTLGMNQAEPAAPASPVQMGTLTNWTNKGFRSMHCGHINTSGELYMWGLNIRGEVGNNTDSGGEYKGYSSPVQLPGTTWSDIKGGSYNSIATKTDGTLWAWGKNHQGQLGQNSQGPSSNGISSPVQIPGTTWATGDNKIYIQIHAAAIKTDGTLWTWGYNEYGELGHNNTIEYSSPVQVPGTTWSTVHGNSPSGTTYAIKTDGTLWSWGRNSHGGLGQNQPENTYRSSPVQIPGTDWSAVGSLSYGFWALKS